MKLNNATVLQCVLLVGFCSVANAAYCTERDSIWRSTSQEYSECIDKAKGVHSEMVYCVRNEVGRHNKNIASSIAEAGKDLSVADLASSINQGARLWGEYVKESCGLYSELGGQRGELLRENCILKEIMQREFFIVDIIKEASM